MPQRQYTTYQADILSFELRDAILGIIKPGRYIGFDVMTEWQAKAGDNVYCEIENSGYIAKYDETNPTPVLEANRGVAVSTQGTIIADDLAGTVTQLTVPLINGGASSKRVHIVFMNHAYSGVPGANNATYGIKSGTEGGGIPILDYPTRQVVLGYIIEPIGATLFSHLAYHPKFPGVGDEDLYRKLFQSSDDGEIVLGTMPTSKEGIIGNRIFTNQNYITNYEAVTKALSNLDGAIKTRADDITTLQITKLDDWATPDDNTDLDASITRHGLLPRLSNDNVEFLNGEGGWTKPTGKYTKRRPTIPSGDDVSLTLTAASGSDNISSIVTDSDADMVLLDLRGYHIAAPASLHAMFNFYKDGDASAQSTRFALNADRQAIAESNSSQYCIGQVWVPYNGATGLVRWTMSPGTLSDISYVGYKVIAWQTANA